MYSPIVVPTVIILLNICFFLFGFGITGCLDLEDSVNFKGLTTGVKRTLWSLISCVVGDAITIAVCKFKKW